MVDQDGAPVSNIPFVASLHDVYRIESTRGKIQANGLSRAGVFDIFLTEHDISFLESRPSARTNEKVELVVRRPTVYVVDEEGRPIEAVQLRIADSETVLTNSEGKAYGRPGQPVLVRREHDEL